ncbi:GNAT family N-acetyltransferase, partial [Endothiovibrio diazotrophicus]
LLELSGELIGYAAFHDHPDNSRHIFGVEVHPAHRQRGLATFMVERILERTRDEGIERLRIGGGNNRGTNAIHEEIGARGRALCIIKEPGNWIRILRHGEID